MKKNTTWIIVIIIILVVLGIILLSSPKAKAPKTNVPAEEKEGVLLEGNEATVPESGQAEKLEGAVEIVPEGSKVSEEGKVLTDSGEEADNTALPGSPEAPQQSRTLNEDEIPSGAIKLSVSSAGFEPNEFTVNAGEVVTISVTSTDKTHVFKFDGETLRGVAIGVSGGETRAITFNAPEAGDYTFFCDVPGHRGRGETGVMHVK